MTGETVRIAASDGGAFGAYLAIPASGKGPGIVVLQEIFGINGFVRSVVDWLAGQGYVAIAPDLFWRQDAGLQLNPGSEEDRARAMGLLKDFDDGLAVEDCEATIGHLRNLEECSGKIGAVGYCLGGKLAYLMAARSDVDAAVGYYGVAIHAALGEADNLRAPLLLHMAADDNLCPPEAQQAIAAALRPRGARIETYAGVGHGFARKGAPIYAAEPAERADIATLGFLRDHLL